MSCILKIICLIIIAIVVACIIIVLSNKGIPNVDIAFYENDTNAPQQPIFIKKSPPPLSSQPLESAIDTDISDNNIDGLISQWE